MTFIEFFNRVYVLNLPERTDRLRHIKREMARMHMPFTSPKVRLFQAIKPEDKAPFHKLGSKGCFLSTLHMLKECRDEHLDNLLILQDDALFLPAFAGQEERLIQQLKEKKWDLAQFGYLPLPNDPASEAFANATPEDFGALIPFSGEVIGAHCFAVNGQCFDRYIEFLEGLLARPLGHPDGGPMPIDGTFNVFSWKAGVTRLVVTPSLVSQKSSRSDVTPGRLDKISILRPLLSILRQLGITRLLRRR